MLTTLQAEVTKTATFNGSGVDVSGITGPFEVVVTVDALTANKTAILQLQTSADSFSSDVRVEKEFSFRGPFSSVTPSGRSVHRYDMSGIRFGNASVTARLAVSYIDSSSSISYSAAIKS